MIKLFVLSISFFTLSAETTVLPEKRIFGVSAHFSCSNQTTLANENTVKVFLSMDGNLTDDSFGASWCPSWSGHLELAAAVENEEEFQPHLVAYHRCNKDQETGGRCRRTIVKMDKDYTFQKGNDSFFEVNLLDPINTDIVTDKM
ncbi:unnamed protein product [Bursaphelenchus xylophilus]|uniref:(pine wood nematode) hypothetical protein n=1 Tax=Bursaphelenchus xylophilus TaxID=6326 RepID=A0A1I7RZA4_BURXY|nr:unnamed protein product [Bursaphelenchus xylophilus]CAG9106680.1 unnamed protein product [Bursaphelenchus xylophilus]